ncbi:hypothetical protein FEZ51_08370 [Pediococcus stilesii]|uniref:Uncharacterized protein n=1 Tax=Pediococcus stilesii TaxID=331679 RepID=A0A5R9BU65_9LACO|nr:hypothetical protein [Pediococcus stilesii]TLQ03610.1 hypothetical protein FEZ51_08370 [Pediococcus stilesii]
MNLHTYDLVAPGYDEEINLLTDTLVNKFKNAITNNSNELLELINRDSFDFISKSGEIIDVVENKYIPVGKYKDTELYVSVLDQGLVFFSKEPNTDMVYPRVFTDGALSLIFRDVELFEDVMHVAGLTGVLEKSIEYKGKQLKILNNYVN